MKVGYGIMGMIVAAGVGCHSGPPAGPDDVFAVFRAPDDSLRLRRTELPEGIRAVWIGHATVLIELPGGRILTDPLYAERVGLSLRLRPPAIAWEDLSVTLGVQERAEADPPGTECPRGPDLVVISHAHPDHFDPATLRRLGTGAAVVCPKGMARTVRRVVAGPVVPLEVGQDTQIRQLHVTAVHAEHGGVFCPALGYVIESAGRSVYFAGDTGYGPHFSRIGRQFQIDLALLPIGTHKPRWLLRRQHVNPEEAVQAAAELNAKCLLPIHWGTFRLFPWNEPANEPRARLESFIDERGCATTGAAAQCTPR